MLCFTRLHRYEGVLYSGRLGCKPLLTPTAPLKNTHVTCESGDGPSRRFIPMLPFGEGLRLSIRFDVAASGGVVYGWCQLHSSSRVAHASPRAGTFRPRSKWGHKSVDPYLTLASRPFQWAVGANMRRPTGASSGVGPARARPDWQHVCIPLSPRPRGRGRICGARDVL